MTWLPAIIGLAILALVALATLTGRRLRKTQPPDPGPQRGRDSVATIVRDTGDQVDRTVFPYDGPAA